MATRKLKPRPAPPPAVLASQHTAPALFGFKTEQAVLDGVRKLGVPHKRHGKTVFFEVEAMRAALLAGNAGENLQCSKDDDDHQPQTADEVLGSIGLRRAS